MATYIKEEGISVKQFIKNVKTVLVIGCLQFFGSFLMASIAHAQSTGQAASINEILQRGIADNIKNEDAASAKVQDIQRKQATLSSGLPSGTCTDNGDGTFNGADGTIWQKCTLGSVWQNGKCEGRVAELNFLEALNAAKNDRFLGHSDWMIPSAELFRNTFFKNDCKLHSWAKKNDGVNGQYPIRGFWWTSWSDDGKAKVMSQSEYIGTKDEAAVSKETNGYSISTTLARNLPIADEGRFKYSVRLFEKQKIEKATEIAKVEYEERLLREAINNKNPQVMYLAAGSYERNGDGYKASQIYQAIITRFPSSNWAVKANDQLNEAKRSSDAQSAANQRQYDAQRANQDAAAQSRNQCSVRIGTCESSCGYGSGSWPCKQRCQSMCSQF